MSLTTNTRRTCSERQKKLREYKAKELQAISARANTLRTAAGAHVQPPRAVLMPLPCNASAMARRLSPR